ncbi:hypothetical protein CcI6DRAFT_04163 [Frankia sp. CcI6]|uniref:hypothetical protein n=1 Tax=Frankia TaxID=1854 RepID=UPI0003CFD65B|nr:MULTISPECIES: hypothetical protein [Frankia]ETA00408.1 hypothetical protein CcI6DRAFT_04163 [Frankia sp. CcI6]KEZ37068.1 hypothetical protein CEDDRAFT_01595 [Frankia sp. CeD]KFB03042.1 hypothetical protein ALLO2DRAFT_04217 [Frankia sp. Allo2]OAA20073.1 hypothetical protein AAY23_109825 [Frankia casuarinae]OHV51117.1 hypothetical protein CgIS1_19605 [Frankia sp. CgIS1]
MQCQDCAAREAAPPDECPTHPGTPTFGDWCPACAAEGAYGPECRAQAVPDGLAWTHAPGCPQHGGAS